MIRFNGLGVSVGLQDVTGSVFRASRSRAVINARQCHSPA